MPPDPKNPIYDLLSYNKSDIDGMTIYTNALVLAIMDMQVEMYAEHKNISIESAEKHSKELTDKYFKLLIENLPKHIK